MDTALYDEEIMHTRALLEEGLASGICDDDPKAVIERIIAERRARHEKRVKS